MLVGVGVLLREGLEVRGPRYYYYLCLYFYHLGSFTEYVWNSVFSVENEEVALD